MEKFLAGYKQVDSFGPDEEYDDDTEEIYVTLDLGNVEPTLLARNSTYRLIVSVYFNLNTIVLTITGFR